MLSAFAKKPNNRPSADKKQANQPTAEEMHPLWSPTGPTYPPEGGDCKPYNLAALEKNKTTGLTAEKTSQPALGWGKPNNRPSAEKNKSTSLRLRKYTPLVPYGSHLSPRRGDCKPYNLATLEKPKANRPGGKNIQPLSPFFHSKSIKAMIK